MPPATPLLDFRISFSLGIPARLPYVPSGFGVQLATSVRVTPLYAQRFLPFLKCRVSDDPQQNNLFHCLSFHADRNGIKDSNQTQISRFLKSTVPTPVCL